MSDAPDTYAEPSKRDVVEFYFNFERYQGMGKMMNRIMSLALERACGMISERLFLLEVWKAASGDGGGFPREHAEMLAEHAYTMLCGVSVYPALSPIFPDSFSPKDRPQ